jgi:MFS family permease
MFWVSVVTNSFPMLWQMATYKDMGIYTGLYYFFSQAAGIIAPVLTGGLRDLFGDRAIFINAAVFMLLAFLIMGKVRKGEPEPKEA